VVEIRPGSREVVVGRAEDLGRSTVRLDELNWLTEPLAIGDRCEVQLRYRSRAIPATVASRDPDSLELRLDAPARAVAPGQSGVVYGPSDQLLGGGVIA
jgi:tRNA-specific 2-thiouridylase